MERDKIKNVILDQQASWEAALQRGEIVPREGLEVCRRYLAHPTIVLVSGPRRAGKSYFSRELVGKAKAACLNFDDERLLGMQTDDLQTVFECFLELYEGFTHVVLDEIQNVPGWELFAGRLRNDYRVIVTGSNAKLLSREMATHLTGRYMETTLFPMSFREFLVYKKVPHTAHDVLATRSRTAITNAFQEYLAGGGIFEYYRLGAEHLRALWAAVITRDIATRYALRLPLVLEQLALLAANHYAAKISMPKLSRTLGLKSPHTAATYLRALENGFLVFTLHKFSYKVKEQLATLKKIYVIDNGFIRALSMDFSENRGRLLENLVAIELYRSALRSNGQVFYWDNASAECDFVVKQGRAMTMAVQVCADLHLENETREIKGLVAALRECKLKSGLLLTGSQEKTMTVEGCRIKVMPVWKWLLAQGT